MAVIQSVAIGVSVLVVVILVYMAAMRSKHHYTSALTCPKCNRAFDLVVGQHIDHRLALLGGSLHAARPRWPDRALSGNRG
ncbi:MAG: hypothetical protein JRN08_06875 [Nitrososphaerota archaeon]|nr:hypothetical protein [Nitrososphaerota archaeon]